MRTMSAPRGSAALLPGGVFSAQTVVILGDSLTEQGGYLANGTSPIYKPNSYWTWANIQLGWRFNILSNAGVFGQTTADILARLERDVIALNPGWCWLLAGTNDVGKGFLETATKPNLRRILDRLEKAGIKVAWLTIPPRITASYTGSTKVDTLALNNWIRAEAHRRPNVVLCDIWPTLAGGTANYLGAVYGHNPTSDGIHLSSCGGFAAGQVVAAAVAPLSRAAEIADPVPQGSGTAYNMLGDPRFVNSSTSIVSPWTANNPPAGITYSKTARTDMNFSWQTVTIPSATTSTFSLQCNGGAERSGRSGAALIGKKVVGSVEFALSGLDQAAADGQQGFYISVSFYNGSSFTHNYALSQDTNSPNGSRSGRLMTNPLTVPAGTTTVSLFIYMLGGGTYNLDRAGIYVADDGALAPY